MKSRHSRTPSGKSADKLDRQVKANRRRSYEPGVPLTMANLMKLCKSGERR